MAANGTGSTDARPTISTHVLDTASGKPAAGVHVTLSKLDDDGRAVRMTQALTDGDGRIRDLLDRPLTAGVYRLEFRPSGPRDEGGDDGRFFERIAVDFRVDDVARSCHVPLLLAPYAASTYRGS
ncbi:MAG TPA: hydroxyisourate hydrolase [Candidatus Limnocylindrales bacterium]